MLVERFFIRINFNLSKIWKGKFLQLYLIVLMLYNFMRSEVKLIRHTNEKVKGEEKKTKLINVFLC